VNAEPPLVAKVRRFLTGIQPAKGIVVAVSGGPDSTALLRASLAVRSSTTDMPLVIAHLNHMLRGADSNGDEAFVCGQAELLGLKLRCKRIDIAAEARTAGDNLESVARLIRYNWLEKVALESGMGYVATGHTADDQAETVLHRLLRGTGIQGLRGIAARRPLSNGIEIIRPMLQVTRAEVITYLDKEKQQFREDCSNLDLRLTRNRIRHELLPALARAHSPAIVSHLGQLAEQAEEMQAAIETVAGQLLNEVELPRAGRRLIFERERLTRSPRPLIREMFRLVWRREDWPQADMDFAAWDRLAAVALNELAAVDLPGGIQARVRERVVQLGQGC
jgi:tRNA(Ile)-lysidine synthase